MRYKCLVLLFMVANATALAPDLDMFQDNYNRNDIDVWNFINGMISVFVYNIRMFLWCIDCVTNLCLNYITWLFLYFIEFTNCVIKMLLFNSFMMDLYHYLAYLFIHANTNFGEAVNWLLFFKSRARFVHTDCGVRRVNTHYRVSVIPSRGVARLGLFGTLGLPAAALAMELSLLSGWLLDSHQYISNMMFIY